MKTKNKAKHLKLRITPQENRACAVLCSDVLRSRAPGRPVVYRLFDIWGGTWTVTVRRTRKGPRRP